MTPAERKEFDALKKRVAELEGQEKNDAACINTLNKCVRDLETETAKIDNRTKVRYDSVGECPDWAVRTVSKLVDRGDLRGDGKSLGLTEDLTRTLVVVDRAGGFDK